MASSAAPGALRRLGSLPVGHTMPTKDHTRALIDCRRGWIYTAEIIKVHKKAFTVWFQVRICNSTHCTQNTPSCGSGKLWGGWGRVGGR